MEILIPLLTIGLSLSIPIVIATLRYRNRRRLMELYHAERMAAIERGMELPPLPLDLLGSKIPRRSSTLLPGLVWLFIGIAVLISLQTIAESEALLGLIPVGVGLAYLIYYAIEGRKLEKQAAHETNDVLPHQLP